MGNILDTFSYVLTLDKIDKVFGHGVKVVQLLTHVLIIKKKLLTQFVMALQVTCRWKVNEPWCMKATNETIMCYW